MSKSILFTEITQGFDALSSARKCETTPLTVKVKLKSAQKISAIKLHATEEEKAQGKSAGLAKGYKAISLDTARKQEAND